MYNELLKPGKTLTTNPYKQQLINLNIALIKEQPEEIGQKTRESNLVAQCPITLGCELSTHPQYLTDLARPTTTCFYQRYT